MRARLYVVGIVVRKIAPEGVIIAAVFVIGLAFAIFTQHQWEDYWITFRASLNFATGQGLVYTPGERLHTFTSPLGVLLPGVLSWLIGNHSDMVVLWAFRVVSLLAFGGGMFFFFRALQAVPLQPFSCWFVVALLGLDAKLIDFSINGMETALIFLFLGLAVHGMFVAGPRQLLRLGFGWGGLMWSRPDSCVYIAAMGLGFLLFAPGSGGLAVRRGRLKLMLIAAVVCAVVYLPWFIWAWSYYGSPVPHTVVAKGTNRPPLAAGALVLDLIKLPWTLLQAPEKIGLPFMFQPPYAELGGWPDIQYYFSTLFGRLAALAWFFPFFRWQTRLVSLGCFVGIFYLGCVLNYFPPWYLTTVSVFGLLTIGLLLDEWLTVARKWKNGAKSGSSTGRRAWQTGLPIIVGILILAAQLAVTISTAWELRNQQAIIEEGLRRPIGLWLRAHAQSPHDSVMLEPLGYIGYYSGLKMYDYPGLASAEMVDTRKRLGPGNDNQVYLTLKPDWLVLRPIEAKIGRYVDQEGLKNDYDLVQTFSVADQINAITWLPGRPYLEYDQTFLVYHRKPGW